MYDAGERHPHPSGCRQAGQCFEAADQQAGEREHRYAERHGDGHRLQHAAGEDAAPQHRVVEPEGRRGGEGQQRA